MAAPWMTNKGALTFDGSGSGSGPRGRGVLAVGCCWPLACHVSGSRRGPPQLRWVRSPLTIISYELPRQCVAGTCRAESVSTAPGHLLSCPLLPRPPASSLIHLLMFAQLTLGPASRFIPHHCP